MNENILSLKSLQALQEKMLFRVILIFSYFFNNTENAMKERWTVVQPKRFKLKWLGVKITCNISIRGCDAPQKYRYEGNASAPDQCSLSEKTPVSMNRGIRSFHKNWMK